MLNIKKSIDGEKTILSLSGRVDAITSQKLQTILLHELETAKHLEMDFAELVYISSAGLRVLLLGEKTAKEKKGKQVIKNLSHEIMEIFVMTGFADILGIE
jgi:anti-anti-sigma factor